MITTEKVAISLAEKLPENNTVIDDNTKKLEDITLHQARSIEASDNAITTIENRGRFGAFFVGNKLGILRYQMVQMKDQGLALNALALDTSNSMVVDQINNQTDVLKLQQVKVENFILMQEERFSLFGWLVASL